MLLFKRGIAFLIDMIIIAGVFSVVTSTVVTDIAAMAQWGWAIRLGMYMLILLRDLFGRSLGKKLLGLDLLDTQGKKPPLWKRILRNITFIIFQVEIIVVALNGDHQRLSDQLLHLRVSDWSNRHPYNLRR